MQSQKRTLTENISYIIIGVSLALMSGLGLGHVTEQSMHPRLSSPPPADPVERYALGQNAYKMPYVSINRTPSQSPEYADASYEIGRYENGARILTPEEPARKIERLRLERLQAWNDENFGSDTGLDEDRAELAKTDTDDYAPIDVGAVMDAPESSGATQAGRHGATDSSGV
ncbi:hypothetical protein [Parasphingorhabdus sp.]|uniref:hypothetical protein n=1 Tax=Parasphingorhabdus sp. TaxID=2709688 RepID=UPI0030028A76